MKAVLILAGFLILIFIIIMDLIDNEPKRQLSIFSRSVEEINKEIMKKYGTSIGHIITIGNCLYVWGYANGIFGRTAEESANNFCELIPYVFTEEGIEHAPDFIEYMGNFHLAGFENAEHKQSPYLYLMEIDNFCLKNLGENPDFSDNTWKIYARGHK